MRINRMIEGQASVTWPHWVALAEAGEVAGLDGLVRFDHDQPVSTGPSLQHLLQVETEVVDLLGQSR